MRELIHSSSCVVCKWLYDCDRDRERARPGVGIPDCRGFSILHYLQGHFVKCCVIKVLRTFLYVVPGGPAVNQHYSSCIQRHRLRALSFLLYGIVPLSQGICARTCQKVIGHWALWQRDHAGMLTHPRNPTLNISSLPSRCLDVLYSVQ